MLKILSGVAFATLVTAGVASAATVSVIASSPQGAGNTADVYAAGYGANTPAGATFDNDPTVAPGNVTNVAQSPFNNTSSLGTQDYFSVGAVSGDDGALSPVTLTFGSLQDDFDILWGSIDSYNTISFSLGTDVVFSFTGDELALELGIDQPTRNYEQVALLNFGDFEEGFDSVTFVSDGAAFEFALAAVPLPAAGLLLLGALGAVGAVRRRKTAV